MFRVPTLFGLGKEIFTDFIEDIAEKTEKCAYKTQTEVERPKAMGKQDREGDLWW